MLRVKKALCIGCGLCANNCPEQAISMVAGMAEIDGNRCRECRICVEVCPQGAITEQVPISSRELQTTVASLKQKTEELIERIEKIKKTEHNFSNVSHEEGL
jgi:electron transfer flavoprotein alpha subunit